MAANTKIEWATHTFNPWIGCTRVSPACDNCYAASMMDDRLGRAKWGPGEPRSRTSTGNWKQPYKWDRQAKGAADRPGVFCASLADVFDIEVPDAWRSDLFKTIANTPSLDWLLLSKRPDVARRFFRSAAIHWPNIWLGTTVENQRVASSRIQSLWETPHVAIRFLSMEPLLEPVDLRAYLDPDLRAGIIDWVIVGGESGRNARPMSPEWAESLRDQCAEFGVKFFMKQMSGTTAAERKAIPDGLRIRQIPQREVLEVRE